MIFLDQNFFLCLKIISFIYIFHMKFNPILKKFITNYLLINLVHNYVSMKLFNFRFGEGSFFDFIILNFGFGFTFYQWYSAINFLNFICKKKVKIHKFFFLLVSIIEFLIFGMKLTSYINTSNLNTYTLHHSKIVFFLQFIVILFFIFMYIISTMIDFYSYVGRYMVNFKYKKLTIYLFFIFFLQLSIEIFQISFLEFGRFFFKKNIDYFYIMKSDSDNLFMLLCTFNIILYFCVINFFYASRKILEDNYNYSLIYNKIYSQKDIFITMEDSVEFLNYNQYLPGFLFNNVFKNIAKKYNLSVDDVVLIDCNNDLYKCLFDINSIFYKYLIENKIIYYDIIFDLCSVHYICELKEYNMQKQEIDIILALLDRFSIKIIMPVLIHKNLVEKYFVIFNRAKNVYVRYKEDDFKYFVSYMQYLVDIENKFGEFFLYSKFLYLKKVSEFNFIENDFQHDKMYQHVVDNIGNIKQGFLYEDKKSIIKYNFNNTFENFSFFDFLHKKRAVELDFSNQLNKYIFLDSNKYYVVASNNKVLIGRYTLSFYTYLSFAKVKNNILEYIIPWNNVYSIFPLYADYLYEFIDFFYFLQNNYHIKIISFRYSKLPIFQKILRYILSDISLMIVSFKDIEHRMEEIYAKIDEVCELNKKIFFWIVDISPNTIIWQNKFLHYFIKKSIQYTYLPVKIIFCVLNAGDEFSFVSHEILSLAKIMHWKDFKVGDIKSEDMIIILKNYSINIMKKNCSIKLIKEILDLCYDINLNSDLYSFINYFFIVLDVYIIKKQGDDEETTQYIQKAIQMGKQALSNVYLMNKLGSFYNFHYSKIAHLLQVNKSTISRYYNKNK